MNSLEVIKKVARILKIPNIYKNEDIDSITETNETEILSSNEDLNLCFDLLKLQIKEIASNVCEIIKSIVLTPENNRISLNNIGNFLKIKKIVYDNQLVSFKIINNYIVLPIDKTVEIIYSEDVQPSSLLEDIDYFKGVSDDVLVYGLCSYYSLSSGLFEEYNNFHSLYEEKIKNCKNVKVFSLKLRDWV